MRTRWTLRAFVTATAIVVQTVALAPAYSGPGEPEEPVRLLDVPFVPQSGVLCGGAAVAMVLRYWGERAVLAEDFGPLVRPGEPGIRTEDLVEAVRARGWTALPFTGSPADMRRHLAQGRPVIALFQEAPGSFHYVVLVSWASGGVILHDPAVGPFRVRREAEFDAAWSKRGRWALLILPPQHGPSPAGETPAAERSESSQPKFSDCDSLVEQGIRLARAGDTAGAEARLLAARSLCPLSAAPLRELAGLSFRAEDWSGAARLAELAAERDPADADTWRLLAGSRYLAGDVTGALEAWNAIAEPRADVARIDGLVRIRYRAVAGQLDLPPGELLTSGAYERARRRLDELPARSESRITLRPLAEGSAQVNVAMLERPLLFGGKWDVGAAGLHAIAEREIALNVASPTGHGELWTAAWRFQEERPGIALGLAAPAPASRPGIWHVNGFWERQAYQVATEVVREERRRAALAFSDWVGADVRLELGAALDRWKTRDTDLSLAAAIETRHAGDRLALGAGFAGWTNLDGGAPFQAGSLWARWTTSASAREVWRARAGVTHATAHAPLALWPGAGTGLGRDELLRAHPLLTDGVVTGPAFGRTLVHAGIERQHWAWTIAPVRAGWALFLDSAKPFDTLDSGPVSWNVDAGAGLRLAGMGAGGQFRLDVARGLVDPRWALSLGWESR